MTHPTLPQIDLHYHAGLERQPAASLSDYLEHALTSGRRWLGITDHVEAYIAPDARSPDGRNYPFGQAGLAALAAEMNRLRAQFPGLNLFFAPEYYTVYSANGQHLFPIEDIQPWLFELADYVIFDSGLSALPGPREKTAALIQAMRVAAEYCGRYGKPCYMAHPLRCVGSLENSWRAITPAVLALAEQAAQQPGPELLNQLFEIDLPAVARASAACGVPLEINGMTQYHIRRAGPAVYQAYVEAYRLMAAEGGRFVFGSDLHKISEQHRSAGWWQPIEAIGEECLDRAFFANLGIEIKGGGNRERLPPP